MSGTTARVASKQTAFPSRANTPEGQQKQAKLRESSPQGAEVASTSYEAMLREAYDNDTSEHMAAAATGLTAGRRGSAAANESDRKVSAKSKRVASDDAILASIRESRGARSVTAPQADVQGKDAQASAKARHDSHIMGTSKMGVNEVATHVSLRSFISLIRILQNWQRIDADAFARAR
ncbi:hypothetical protein [Chelativorans sp. Marseille-P2723]|uniref:hypothetical protein n=1 Tax=Chelativorans sp. Marseille-P2723 TaxID=2709133 RepID=UPI0015710069|nr:hypothetical protein [Chelativorans sp. Marseille-P2723]